MHVFGIAIQVWAGLQAPRKHILEPSLPDLWQQRQTGIVSYGISWVCQLLVSCRWWLLEGCGVGEHAWPDLHLAREVLIGT
jgi:hypothetical protein